jgi:mycothiol synthase
VTITISPQYINVPPKPYRTRPYTGNDDLHRLSRMLDACEAEDKMGVNRSSQELQVQFDSPMVDAASQTCFWENDRNLLRAYGLLEIEKDRSRRLDGTLRWRVHPLARADQLDDDVITWGEKVLLQKSQEAGLPAAMQSITRHDDIARLVMLQWHGYALRHEVWQMNRWLAKPLEKPTLPEGFTIRPADAAKDAEAWVDMYNDSFFDHPNHHDLTVAEYHHRRQTDPGYLAQRDLVVCDAQGQMAALCWSLVNPEEIARADGEKVAMLNEIGTRRGFRQMGLAKALLWATLAQLKDEGLDSVRLYVYTDNENQASTLYEAAGFEQTFSLMIYQKDFPAPTQG